MDFMDLLAGWNAMKTWQKAIGVIFVALVIFNLGFEFGRNIGVVHPQENTIHVDLSGNVIPNTTHFVDRESLNGTGRNFILAHVPNPTSSLQLYWNGVKQYPDCDYNLSGNSITLLSFNKESEDQVDAAYRW